MSEISAQSQVWFPIHPRALPFVRAVGGVSAAVGIYIGVTEQRWSIPALLVFWLLFVRAELRPRTFYHQFAIVCHWLLVIAITGFVCFAAVSRLLAI